MDFLRYTLGCQFFPKFHAIKCADYSIVIVYQKFCARSTFAIAALSGGLPMAMKKWLLIDFKELKLQVSLFWNQNFSPVPNRDCPPDSPDSLEIPFFHAYTFIFSILSLTCHFFYGRTLGIHLIQQKRYTKIWESQRRWERKMQEKECFCIIQNHCIQIILVFT